MNPITFIVEKTNTGFSAYAEDFENFSIGTTSNSMGQLKENLLDAINLHQEHHNGKSYNSNQIVLKYDLPQFFEFYKEINAKSLAKRIGMNQTLLSQYVNGIKKPSDKQVHKILTGVRQLGKELTELELI